MPKIYTKKGDQGTTTLYQNRTNRISKSDIVFTLLGTIDKLQVYIGECTLSVPHKKEELRQLQRILIVISGYISRYSEVDSELLSDWVKWMELSIDEMTVFTGAITKFVLPVTGLSNACIHLARVTTRDSERLLVNYIEEEKVVVEEKITFEYTSILKFFNRLSDYFFALARWQTHLNGDDENIFLSGKVSPPY